MKKKRVENLLFKQVVTGIELKIHFTVACLLFVSGVYAVNPDTSSSMRSALEDNMYEESLLESRVKDLNFNHLNEEGLLSDREKLLGEAQETVVSGQITDKDGQPLPGVKVVIKGTTVGVISDFDGKYSLQVPDEGGSLEFTFVGMETVEVSFSGQSKIDVTLQESSVGLEEVVAVGYGVQKKSLVTGAISSVKSDQLESVPVSRADQALQGRAAGVSVLSASGSPGAGTKIRIRGVNSNGNSNPLFIVDGMKTGDINNIDPADIESMEILKDAASAAIYGTEGGNGVIIITTKSGAKGERAKINYNFQYGIQSSRSDLDLMNATQYKEWMDESGAGTVTLDGTDTDWMDEVFENAPMQQHHISYSSGNDKSSYMLSGSYFAQDGIVGGSKAKYDRYTARINAKSSVNDWIEVGNNISFSHSRRKYIGEDSEYTSLVNATLLVDPLTPVVYDEIPDDIQDLIDGGYPLLQNDEGKYYAIPSYATGEISNPVALSQIFNSYVDQDKIMGTAYATIKPFEGFSFTSRVGLDLTYQVAHSWTPTYYLTSERQNPQTSVDDNINKWYTWLWENFATYKFDVADHSFTLLGGYSAQKYQSPNWTMHSAPLIMEGDDFAYQGYTTSNDYDRTGGVFVEETMTSFYGRLSYDYLSKYMLEASVRRDAASVFPSDKPSAVFPAFSAGWVLSNEGFYNSSKINYIKLRASWGQNGSKSNLPGNEDQTFWVFGSQYPGADGVYQSGAEIDKFANTELVWERTQQIDLGIDFRAFESRLTFSVDYYSKLTKDLIIQGSGPLSLGNDWPYVNGGDVRNRGFEFELGYRDNVGAFNYNVNLNLSTLDNEVTSLSSDAAIAGANLRGYNLTWFEEGYPIWYFKGYKTNGVDPSNGDPVVVDVNEDGEITAADQTYIGDPTPDILYGATFSCEYKGFDLNLFLQGTHGNDVFMGWFRSDRPFSNKPAFMYNDRWTPDNINASRPAANNTSDYIYRSDLMVSDGSYLRIKQIQLGYTLPDSWVSKVRIDRARFYVSLDDYFTFTKYKGLDPEAGSSSDNSQGVDRGIYPISGKVLFGFSLNF